MPESVLQDMNKDDIKELVAWALQIADKTWGGGNRTALFVSAPQAFIALCDIYGKLAAVRLRAKLAQDGEDWNKD